MKVDDEAEFRNVAAANMRGLRRTAFLLCGDWHHADDVVQNVLTKLHRNWTRIQRREQVDAYVRTMVVRATFDRRRRLFWRRELTTAEMPENPVDDDAHVEDRMVLFAALDRMPPRQRAVLVLRFFNDLDVAETASILGCTAVTAGVVSGPALLGLGSTPPEMSTGGQGTSGATSTGGTNTAGPTTTKTPDDLTHGKSLVTTPCATPPQVDWAQIVLQSVPGATARVTPKASAPAGTGCITLPDGSMDIEVLLTIGNPNGAVQIDVDTGGSKEGRPSASATPNADLQAKMDALKAQRATEQPTGHATSGPPPAVVPSKAEGLPTCSTVAPGEQVCVTHIQKGGYLAVSAALSRTTPTPLFVQVIGSTGEPAGPAGTPPLSPAQVSSIAQAVAGHF